MRAATAQGCPVEVGTDVPFEMIPAYPEFGFGTTTPEELRAVATLMYWRLRPAVIAWSGGVAMRQSPGGWART